MTVAFILFLFGVLLTLATLLMMIGNLFNRDYENAAFYLMLVMVNGLTMAANFARL